MTSFNKVLIVSILSVCGSVASAKDNNDIAYANELISDAHSHRNPNNGFVLSSGDNSLRIGGDIQFRYASNFNGGGRNYTGGFENNFTRLRFDGNLQSYDYNVSFAYLNNEFNLQNANVSFDLLESTRVRVGQFRLQFLQEQTIDETRQLAANESFVSSVFGQGYSQGVEVTQSFDNFDLIGAFSDGFNSANTNFNSTMESDVSGTIRLNYYALGQRSNFNTLNSIDNNEESLMFGGSVSYQDGENRNVSYTLDSTFMEDKFCMFVSGVGRQIENSTNTYSDYGFVAQSGYRILDNLELFARYEGIYADSDRFSSSNFNFATAGMNYYLLGNAMRFTLDSVYSFNDSSNLPLLGNTSGGNLLGRTSEGEILFRGQLQMVF